MTKQEEMAAIGRMVIEYQEAKRHFAVICAEGQRIGQGLVELGQRFLPNSPVGLSGFTWDNHYTELLDANKLSELLDDWRATGRKIRELENSLREVGALP